MCYKAGEHREKEVWSSLVCISNSLRPVTSAQADPTTFSQINLFNLFRDDPKTAGICSGNKSTHHHSVSVWPPLGLSFLQGIPVSSNLLVQCCPCVLLHLIWSSVCAPPFPGLLSSLQSAIKLSTVHFSYLPADIVLCSINTYTWVHIISLESGNTWHFCPVGRISRHHQCGSVHFLVHYLWEWKIFWEDFLFYKEMPGRITSEEYLDSWMLSWLKCVAVCMGCAAARTGWEKWSYCTGCQPKDYGYAL